VKTYQILPGNPGFVAETDEEIADEVPTT